VLSQQFNESNIIAVKQLIVMFRLQLSSETYQDRIAPKWVTDWSMQEVPRLKICTMNADKCAITVHYF